MQSGTKIVIFFLNLQGMWIWLTLCSALFLGIYDVAKKKAIEKNDIYWILLGATALSTVFLCPFLGRGPLQHHAALVFKAVLVSMSWIFGMIALKHLPITMVSTFKASRPMFVLLFSLIIYGERLSLMQWSGVLVIMVALYLLALSGGRDGISFVRNWGVWAMIGAVLTGVVSALFDKHILAGMGMKPLFVQSWTNLYISIILAIVILIRAMVEARKKGRGVFAFPAFRPDWMIVAVAVLITIADMCYFFALNADGAMLSVVSLLRRSSTIVTFAVGALVFRERRVGSKAGILAILLLGVMMLAASSL